MSAAWERPAPTAGDDDDRWMAQPTEGAGRPGARPAGTAGGDGGGPPVLGGPGQGSRGRRAGLHPGDDRPLSAALMSGWRAVDERDEHVLLHLLDGGVLDEVRADAPVLLGRVEHPSVDQPLFGVCNGGWLRKNRNRRGPGDLGDGGVDRPMCFGNTGSATTTSTEWSATGRASAPAARAVGRAARRRTPRRPGPRWVDADHPGGAALDGQAGHLASPSPSRTVRAPGQVLRPAAGSAPSYSGSAPAVKPSCHQPACSPSEVARLLGARIAGPPRGGLSNHGVGHLVGQPRQRPGGCRGRPA